MTSTINIPIFDNTMQSGRQVLLNDGFLSIFYPFYYMNTIACMRKYNINKNYVTNITKKNIVCAGFMGVLMIIFYCVTMKYTIFGVIPYKFVYNIIYFDYLFNFFFICIINLYYSHTSARLLSILNEIHKYAFNSTDSMKFKLMSWISTATLFSCCVLLVAFKLAYDPYWNLWRGAYVSMSIILDLEIVYVTVLTFILTTKTSELNDNIESMYFGNDSDDITVDGEIVLEEMEHVLESVDEAWSLVVKTSGLVILLHFITTFVQTLVYVGVLIIWSKHSFEDLEVIISHTSGVLLWLSKVFFIELGLCLVCEAFYRELARAQDNVLIKLFQELPSKTIWKNMLRILHKDFKELSACGVFNVDAATLMHFCKLVATYTIALLQFAFL